MTDYSPASLADVMALHASPNTARRSQDTPPAPPAYSRGLHIGEKKLAGQFTWHLDCRSLQTYRKTLLTVDSSCLLLVLSLQRLRQPSVVLHGTAAPLGTLSSMGLDDLFTRFLVPPKDPQATSDPIAIEDSTPRTCLRAMIAPAPRGHSRSGNDRPAEVMSVAWVFVYRSSLRVAVDACVIIVRLAILSSGSIRAPRVRRMFESERMYARKCGKQGDGTLGRKHAVRANSARTSRKCSSRCGQLFLSLVHT